MWNEDNVGQVGFLHSTHQGWPFHTFLQSSWFVIEERTNKERHGLHGLYAHQRTCVFHHPCSLNKYVYLKNLSLNFLENNLVCFIHLFFMPYLWHGSFLVLSSSFMLLVPTNNYELSCKGGSHTSALSWAWGCFRTSRECTNMGTSPYINNSLFISSFLSRFVGKKYFHGNVGTYKIGGDPHNNGLGFYWWRSLKILIEIEKELFTYWNI